MTSINEDHALQRLRGTDSNSLLRLYDRARQAQATPGTRQEREQADKAVRRIAQELQNRDIRV
jgi:hypothetical protein